MYPVLLEIPNAWKKLGGGALAVEIVVGLAAFLVWLSYAARKRKGGAGAVGSWIAFVVAAHLVLSAVMVRKDSGDHELPAAQQVIPIYSFAAMVVLGFLAGTFFAARRARALDIPEQRVFDFGLWLLLIGIAGARLFYAFLNWEEFSSNKLEILKIWRGGLVWYGGLLPMLFLGPWLMHRFKMPVLVFLDLAAVSTMLGLSIGRIGCFLIGDDYGSPTDLPWGVKFFDPQALVAPALKEGAGVALHPTQLYMSLNAAWIFFIVEVVRRRTRFAGTAFAWMVILYAATRGAVIESFRGDFAERNPGYYRHVAVRIDVRKGEGSEALRLERGRTVRGAEQGREGSLLGDLSLPPGEASGSVYAASVGAVPGAGGRPQGEAPPAWEIKTLGGLPEGVTVRSAPSEWYDSHLGVPPGYFSTSQWVSLLLLPAAVAFLWICRRRESPGYRRVRAEVERRRERPPA
ncbi:MAG: prolipoprotein diacylglyceryl transferase [Planctomycetota bacterium]